MKFDTSLAKAIGFFAGIATLIVTGFAIWDRVKPHREPSAELVATVSSGPYILPFFVEEKFDMLHKAEDLRVIIDSSQALLAIKDKQLREKIGVEISENLSQYMREYRSEILRGSKFTPVTKYWNIEVENKGTNVAKNVRLRLPTLAYIKLSRENYKSESNYSNLVELKELQPLERASISAWYGGFTIGQDEFRLTHSDGIGRIIQK